MENNRENAREFLNDPSRKKMDAYQAVVEYASQFTSSNEGSVVVTDEMIEKEATDYCDCLVYEDTERYADYDYFKSCYVSACAWVRDQYEKK